MFNRFKSLLRDMWLFFEYRDLTLKLLHPNPLKRGFLIKRNGEDGVSYSPEFGGFLIMDIDDHFNWLVQKMINRGVPIIPEEEMEPVWAGTKKVDDLLTQYISKKK